MMPNSLLWVCIGSITFHLITGLTLTSNNSILYTTGFTLICDVQGTITTSLTITDPSGTTAVSCFAPPLACGSVNTYNRDIAAGTLTVNILQANIHTTNSVGSWSCTDGTSSVTYQVTEIVSFREPVVRAASADDGAIVTVKFECIYPYPDEINIEYVKASDNSSVLKTATGVTFTNGTASNCPVADARAISIEGTFTLSHSGLAESAVIKAAVSFSGSVSPSGYSNFTVTIATTNGKGSLFLHAFLPVFLIVLIGINIFFVLIWCVCKDGPFKQGSMKGCSPSNIICNIVCPMCTKPKAICSCCSGVSFIVQCAISVIVFLCVAAIIGVIIAFGLGLESGKDDLALGLSIVFGIVLLVIYIISVYPRLAYAPNERENGGNCFRTCRISTVDEPNTPAGNQASPNRDTSRSPQASASEVRVTTETN